MGVGPDLMMMPKPLESGDLVSELNSKMVFVILFIRASGAARS